MGRRGRFRRGRRRACSRAANDVAQVCNLCGAAGILPAVSARRVTQRNRSSAGRTGCKPVLRQIMSATIWPSVFVPASGGMTSFTRCTRRSPLAKVPLFSKNDAPGSTTFANFAVSLMKISCTTGKSSEFSAVSERCAVARFLQNLREWAREQIQKSRPGFPRRLS